MTTDNNTLSDYKDIKTDNLIKMYTYKKDELLCSICSRTDIPDTFWIDTMSAGDEQFIKLILSYRKIPIKFFIYLDEYSFFEEMLEHKNYTSSDVKDALELLANTKFIKDANEKKDHFEMLLYEMDEEHTEPCDVCGLEHEIEEYKKYQTVYLPKMPQKYMDDLKRHYKQYETVNVCLKCVSKVCFNCCRKGTDDMFNYHRHCEKCNTWICPTCGVWSRGRACCPEKLKF